MTTTQVQVYLTIIRLSAIVSTVVGLQEALMPSPYPYFPFYAADFDTDTKAMSPLAVGVYIRLLIYQWINGTIPTHAAKLTRISQCSNQDEFEMAWGEIQHKFPTINGEHVNPRLERERQKTIDLSEKASRAGKASVRARAARASQTSDTTTVPKTVKPNGNHSESESDSDKREDKNSAAGAAQTDLAGPVPKRKAHRIPENWEPDSKLLAWAADKVPNVDSRYETEKFRDYWMAASGQRACKLDWRATWRNWMRTAGERGGQKQGNRARGGAGERVRQATGLDE